MCGVVFVRCMSMRRVSVCGVCICGVVHVGCVRAVCGVCVSTYGMMYVSAVYRRSVCVVYL